PEGLPRVEGRRKPSQPDGVLMKRRPPRRLLLESLHRVHGAEFERVGEWLIPSHYGEPLEEYAACRTAVGLSDFSHLGRIAVHGEGRHEFLDRLLPRKIFALRPGQGTAACLLAPHGTLLADVSIYNRTDHLLCLLRPERHEVFLETDRRNTRSACALESDRPPPRKAGPAPNDAACDVGTPPTNWPCERRHR